ncbi:MAG: winged helix-turn-helix transcriptional regulator [Bdellovibrionales bacterium]|nr:winged helix-turn-helix transcriptional regulator [Bdellovibrionales bacterium]
MSSNVTAKALLKKTTSVSRVMKSLSHPVRLKVLCSLLEGEQGVNELAQFCEISQSAMSQFLKRMKTEGILSCRREHHFVFYKISDKKLTQLLLAVKKIYC